MKLKWMLKLADTLGALRPKLDGVAWETVLVAMVQFCQDSNSGFDVDRFMERINRDKNSYLTRCNINSYYQNIESGYQPRGKDDEKDVYHKRTQDHGRRSTSGRSHPDVAG